MVRLRPAAPQTLPLAPVAHAPRALQCKVWNTNTGEEILTLEGHKNVVYAIAFNNPFGDKIVTGSFDKTARIWDAETGECIHVLRGCAALLSFFVALFLAAALPRRRALIYGTLRPAEPADEVRSRGQAPDRDRGAVLQPAVHNGRDGLDGQHGEVMGGGYGGGAGELVGAHGRDCEPVLQQRGGQDHHGCDAPQATSFAPLSSLHEDVLQISSDGSSGRPGV